MPEAHRAGQLARLLTGVEDGVAAGPGGVPTPGPVDQPPADLRVGPPADPRVAQGAEERLVPHPDLNAGEAMEKALPEEAGQARLVAVVDDGLRGEDDRVARLKRAVREVHVLAPAQVRREAAELSEGVAPRGPAHGDRVGRLERLDGHLVVVDPLAEALDLVGGRPGEDPATGDGHPRVLEC